MNYRKPGFWIITFALAICIAVAVYFLTSSPQELSYTEIFNESYTSAAAYASVNGVDIKKNDAEIILSDNEITVFFPVIGDETHIRVSNIVSRGKIERQTIILEDKVTSSDESIKPENTMDTAVSAAILNHNQNDSSANRVCVESHKIFANENHMLANSNETDTLIVYAMAVYHEYDDGNYSEAVMENIDVVALTFDVSDGYYSLKEYWLPGDGAYHDLDLMAKFPESVAEQLVGPSDYYLEQIAILRNECKQKVTMGNIGGYKEELNYTLDAQNSLSIQKTT